MRPQRRIDPYLDHPGARGRIPVHVYHPSQPEVGRPGASIQLKGEQMAQVSFSADIKPLFRPIDVLHMKRGGVALDDFTYMSNPANANRVLEVLSPHDGKPPAMPPGGPYWTADQLALFKQWQSGGYQP